MVKIEICLDEKYFISGSHNGICRLWNIWSGKCEQVYKGHLKWINIIMMCLDRKHFISGSPEHICLWDIESGECKKIYNILNVLSIGICLDGEHFVSGGEDSRILLWKLPDYACGIHNYCI